MYRKGSVYYKDNFAGIIMETDTGFSFTYDKSYLSIHNAQPVSLTMPLQPQPYTSSTMLPAFDGIIPEGWLLDLAEKTWKIDKRDRMGLLLKFCNDCIGAISIVEVKEEDNDK